MNRKLALHRFVKDIRNGLSDSQLMDKYEISSKMLLKAFAKLVVRGEVQVEELLSRAAVADGQTSPQNRRQTLRQYPALSIDVREGGYPANKGTVHDISDRGLAVKGMEASLGETKTLIIEADELDEFQTFDFEATCRWVRRYPPNNGYIAGFQITSITHEGLRELLSLTQLQTVTFLD